jgi:Zn-dependent protease
MEQYTLRTRVGSIPVVVHPTFWLLLLLIGFLSAGRFTGRPWLALVIAAAFGVSLLVHELGHCAAYRAFNQRPIAFLSMGGQTIGERPLPPTEQIVVSFAGPLTQIVLVAVPCLVLRTVLDLPVWLDIFTQQLAYFCLFWGIVNLLPALPLDGGNAAVAYSTLRHGNPRMRTIHQIGIGVGAVGIIYSFVTGSLLFLFLWVMVIVLNATALRDPYGAARFGMGGPDFTPSYGGYDEPSRPTRRGGNRSSKRFRTEGSGKPAEVLAAGYDLLERHDPRAARDRVSPLLTSKSKKRDRSHASLITAWSHLREGSAGPAAQLLGAIDENVPGLQIAREVTSVMRGELDLAGLAPGLSAALATLDARRDARQALEVLVRRDQAVSLARVMLDRSDLDGLLRVQQTLHDMGRRSLAQEVSDLLLGDDG